MKLLPILTSLVSCNPAWHLWLIDIDTPRGCSHITYIIDGVDSQFGATHPTYMTVPIERVYLDAAVVKLIIAELEISGLNPARANNFDSYVWSLHTSKYLLDRVGDVKAEGNGGSTHVGITYYDGMDTILSAIGVYVIEVDRMIYRCSRAELKSALAITV